jgi:hypothetical protein
VWALPSLVLCSCCHLKASHGDSSRERVVCTILDDLSYVR